MACDQCGVETGERCAGGKADAQAVPGELLCVETDFRRPLLDDARDGAGIFADWVSAALGLATCMTAAEQPRQTCWRSVFCVPSLALDRGIVVTVGSALMAVILIVEDDMFIRELAETLIQDWGYQTFSASDADEALKLLRSPQHIDLLFTDIYLKTAVCGGCDLAHQAIKLRPQLRVLYVTGNFVTDEIHAQFVVGAQCIRKPYMPRQLQASFENLLAV